MRRFPSHGILGVLLFLCRFSLVADINDLPPIKAQLPPYADKSLLDRDRQKSQKPTLTIDATSVSINSAVSSLTNQTYFTNVSSSLNWNDELKVIPPTVCPFGHTEIKKIPIAYGLLAQTDELQKQIDNLEVWPGGCCVGQEKDKFVCEKCRYSFEPFGESWQKSAADPAQLHFKVDPFLIDWPMNDHDGKPGRLYQKVKDSMVLSEELILWSHSSEKHLDQTIGAYLGKYRFNFARSEARLSNRHVIYYKAYTEGHFYLIAIESPTDSDILYIRVERSLEKPLYY
jgi:hypothetical protein